MSMTAFPTGATVYGVPVLPAGLLSTGTSWFVNANSSTPGLGYSNDSPATTIAAVVSLASVGDNIILLEGHTEAISSSTALTISKAGLKLIGLGYGSRRPTITLDTANTATINVTAASVVMFNIVFVANFLAIAGLFTLTTANDLQLYNCEFRDTSAVLNFVSIVDTNTTSNAADGIVIQGCKRIGLGASSATCIVKMDGTNNRLTVTDNYFSHAATTQAAFMPIATGKVVTNMLLASNFFELVGAQAATTGILITTDGSTNSGYLARNLIQSLDDTTEILVTASSGFRFSQNFYSGAADTSGRLLPVVDT